MPFVLDTSVTMSWCFAEPDPYAAYVRRLLVDDEALVPPIWPLEVANSILVGERHGRLDAAHSARFLSLLRALDVVVDMTGAERTLSVVLDLARAQRLSSYDAAYLELAMRDGVPLATIDMDLRAAAARVGVPLVAGP
jgi:predicted nucleic acid-binding protein